VRVTAEDSNSDLVLLLPIHPLKSFESVEEMLNFPKKEAK